MLQRHAADPLDIAAPVAADVLACEIATLPHATSLMRLGEFEVFCTPSEPVPQLMLEIGRLRELAFRAAGEGTGQPYDLDRFDTHYHQLFVWILVTTFLCHARHAANTETRRGGGCWVGFLCRPKPSF